ncbi:Ig-like domain-containing protein [Metabacillus litoralis]|uniref:Ig-like domain-containing protein n=2 Tax=Bacillaceae TaxID=186817 RepID=UPI00203C3D96|nr:Ig-like domain-containing protein [Metabacillus litoralis]MCM3162728.1 Ig-like domain-containing protein [Metabacillus litoralis]
MSKKKVAKQLGLTAAVAASAVVAANPASAASASTVETAVVQAEKDAIALGKFYRSTDLNVSADFSAAYNKAKKSIESAKAQVATLTGSQKSLLSARVAAADANRLKAAYYIDGVKFVQNDLAEATAALAEHVEAGEITDETVEVYNNLSATIRKAERVIGKIYGSEVRKAIESTYLLDAKFAREAVIYEVSQYELMGEIAEQVAAGELTTAADNFKVLERLKVRAVEIKEAGRALYPDRTDVYPDLPSIETQLRTAETAVVTSYEAALAPAVKSVSAIDLSTVVVEFNKEVDKASAINVSNYTVNGSNPSANAVKLNDDKKSVTITVSALTNNSNARVTVKDVTDTKGTKVSAYDELLYVSDATAPTVASTSYSHAGNVFTINFSENLTAGATSLVKVFDANNVDVTSSATIASPNAKTITIGTGSLAAGKTYKVVMLGAKDLANNYFAGNKVETTFTTSKTDEVKPTVASLDVRNNNTVRVTFSEAISVGAANKIAELKLDDAVSATTVTKVASFSSPEVAGEAIDVYGDGKTWDVKVKATGISGAAKVTLVNFADLEGNVQDTAFNKLATFAADTTAPVVASSKVVGSKLYVSYDEEVAVAGAPLAANSIQLVTPGNVLKDVSASATISVDPTDTTGKTVVVDLGANVATAGSYTVKLASGVVSDKATPANSKAYEHVAQFGGSADTGKPTLYMTGSPAAIDATAIVQSADNKYVTVKFSEKVDSSALNTANYLVNGVAVFENAIFVDDTNVVRLTLKADAISVSGDHQVTVSGVKDLAGNVMDSVTTIETLNENTTPSAQTLSIVNGTTLELTFSEGISDTNAANADFEVKVNGAVVTPSNISVSGNKATFTVATLPSLTTPISVKVLDTNDLEDTAGNVVATKTISIN